jgi:asparagine synthase (glutamine-hydrolysing)
MCAIAGYVHPARAFAAPPGRLEAMRDAMAHRGPDDRGAWEEDGVGLASRRLAILDLSPRGRMPMASADGRFRIVHNGEIYNYRELRSGLEASGHRFTTDTDTEVIHQLYAAYGPSMLDQLNGMFAFAIWDRTERSLFIARDRLGVKPLYLAERDGALWFASEPKALFEAGVEPRFDPSTWEELLCFRYVAGEATPLQGVRRLLPGHALLWRDGRATVRRWWSLAERVARPNARPLGDPAEWFRDRFESAVGYRRISDVPLGVLLSGGLDSSCVASVLSAQAGRGVASFTIRFPGDALDEGETARRGAQAWGLEHHELTVGPETLLEELGRAAWFNDEPLPHGSDIHLLAISRFARPRVTVLLSGEGADETLGGYQRYRPLPLLAWLQRAAPLLRPRLARALGSRAVKLCRILREDPREGLLLYNACDLLPGELGAFGLRAERRFEFRRRMLREAAGVYPDDPLRQAMYSDQHTFLSSVLDVNDKMTMGASIECRVPFLDYRLVEGAAALPTAALAGTREGKRPLRAAYAASLAPILGGYRKRGFTAPWASYFRSVPALRAFLEELPRRGPVQGGPLDGARLRGAIGRFLAGDDRDEPLLRALVMIVSWHEACVARRGSPVRPGAALPRAVPTAVP